MANVKKSITAYAAMVNYLAKVNMDIFHEEVEHIGLGSFPWPSAFTNDPAEIRAQPTRLTPAQLDVSK